MVAVMNLLPYEIQVLAAFLTPLDPEIIYVAWSITAYGFWKATIFQSTATCYGPSRSRGVWASAWRPAPGVFMSSGAT